MDGNRDRTGLRFDADWTDTVALEDWRPSPRALRRAAAQPAAWTLAAGPRGAGSAWSLGLPLTALLLLVGWNAAGFWAYELLGWLTLGLALRLLTGRPRLSLWLLAWLAITLTCAAHLHVHDLGHALTFQALADLPTASTRVAFDSAGLAVVAALLALVLILANGLREPRRPLSASMGGLSALACTGGLAALVWIAATQPLPAAAYSGGYGQGRAVLRLLIGSTFDLSGSPAPSAGARLSHGGQSRHHTAQQHLARLGNGGTLARTGLT